MNGNADTSIARAPRPAVVARRLAAVNDGEAHAARAASPPRIVIVGAGFGALTAAQALRRAPVEVTLIDRQNHHLFQPLLYQIATAGRSAGLPASPRTTSRNAGSPAALGRTSRPKSRDRSPTVFAFCDAPVFPAPRFPYPASLSRRSDAACRSTFVTAPVQRRPTAGTEAP